MRDVSIVITAYKRANLLGRTLESIREQDFDGEVIIVEDGDDGQTENMAKLFGAKYLRRERTPDVVWRTPCVVQNMGLFAVTNDIVIIQGAEVYHEGNLIEKLVAPVREKNVATFARTVSLKENGAHDVDYVSPGYARPFFFCGAVRMDAVRELNGFDEDYVDYGYDDNDFGDRLAKAGVGFKFLEDRCFHQFHGAGNIGKNNLELYNRKTQQMADGIIGVKRNLGRYWDVTTSTTDNPDDYIPGICGSGVYCDD